FSGPRSGGLDDEQRVETGRRWDGTARGDMEYNVEVRMFGRREVERRGGVWKALELELEVVRVRFEGFDGVVVG
ncbi:hypothetical protein ACJ72_08251, partial [Emergomyces africanus]